jgi:hypothetical protein
MATTQERELGLVDAMQMEVQRVGAETTVALQLFVIRSASCIGEPGGELRCREWDDADGEGEVI